MPISFSVDIAIVGGGITGLWMLNRLRQEGYNAVLFERDALGCQQTLASQGMIHGGQRYLLHGAPSAHAEAMRASVETWHSCFEGQGDIDLTSVDFLSHCQYIWCPDRYAEQGSSFYKHATCLGAEYVQPENWPLALDEYGVEAGKLYSIGEKVIETRSLVKAIASPHLERIFRAECVGAEICDDSIRHIVVEDHFGSYSVNAKCFVFAAGSGNEKIANYLRLAQPIAQRRPLKQVMIRTLWHPLYMHCIGEDPRPSMTITAHPESNAGYIWYLGGLLASQAVDVSDDEAISTAVKELKKLLPGLDQRQVEWATYLIDRAEAYDLNGMLPLGSVFKTNGNFALAWPSKMTLVPELAANVLKWIVSRKIGISEKSHEFYLQPAAIGKLPWSDAQWLRV